MKILLLSDIPPCDNFTAGLVLSAMVRFVPRDEICCFAVVNPTLEMQLPLEFSNIPTEVHTKPNENWSWLPRQRFLRGASSVISFVGELLTEQTVVRTLIRKAVAFGREQKVDRVWAVLQGQTMIRMAQAVANQLEVPLYTHVWDPFSWWARANCLDAVTARRVQSIFDNAVRHSKCVATASEPMANLYQSHFGISAVPVIASHPKSIMKTPNVGSSNGTTIVIGMAGQFYAAREWQQLLYALRASNWRVAGRSVRIVVMGPQRPPGDIDDHISFLGWKSQADAALILSNCDVLYCPYPFDSEMKEVSQFSFPSKLVLYLAAGRPILFHGPDYSSPADYIKSRKCGLIANRIEATAVYNELERCALMDIHEYSRLAISAQAAFLNDFTLESMAESFNCFIGGKLADKSANICLHDHKCIHHKKLEFSHARLSDARRKRSLVWSAITFGQRARQRYALMRRESKSLLRRLALRVPRIQSLYHEINTLYENNAALRQKIDFLESENLRLKAINPSGTAAGSINSLSKVVTDEVCLTSVISQQMLSRLYPKTKMLVLTRLLDERSLALNFQNSDNSISLSSYVMAQSVVYIEMPIDKSIDIEWEGDWHDVSKKLPSSAISSVLRLVFQEGIERIVLDGDLPADIAFAVEVSRLASLRMSAVANIREQPSGWLSSQKQIDFIAEPIEFLKHEPIGSQAC